MTVLRLIAFWLIALLAAPVLAHSTLTDITDGEEEQVTLPVVPDSKLIVHDTNGIDVSSPNGTVQSLPLAVFLTLKSPREVVAWYREALPDYTVLTSTGGQHIQILEHTTDATRVDSPDTYQTPNIRIRPTDARMATHMEGARTMLQIYYPPAEGSEQGNDGQP